MRLFVAIYPPTEVLDDVMAQVGRLRVGEAAASGINVRIVDPAVAHVTLAFIGEVDPERLPDVEAALARAADPSRRLAAADPRRGFAKPHPSRRSAEADLAEPTAEVEPIRVRIGGGGRFGRGRFTILWAGLQGDVQALHALARTIRSELRRARLPYDERPFKPHFTIARPGERVARTAIDEDRATLDGYLSPSWPVTEMVLVRSHLGPRPLYHHLTAWPL